MPNVTVHGRELFYDERGEGEPLLLIQGLSGNHLHWGDRFLEALDPDFRSIAYDHRGIGRSGPAGESFTIVDLAQDAAGLLDALGIESAHVLGVSMGGMVAQELALDHPERVRTLALGCTYAGGPGSSLTDQRIVARLTELFMSGQAGLAMQEGLRYNVSAKFWDEPANLEPFKRIAAELPSSLEVMLAQVQAIASHDTSTRLGELRPPTLIVHGEEDQILSVSNARQIAELVPEARLEIIEGVGHLFWWERPERSAELLRELAREPRPAAQ